jgi:hypothetical protein
MVPFRKRSVVSRAGRTARNVAIADAAWALARDRIAGKVPGTRQRRRGPSTKLLIAGGAAAALGTVALLKRDKVAGLLPSRSESEVPAPAAPPPPPPPPTPSNYDAPGPVANTATPVPAPEPLVHPAGLDERAEEEAAAAEAANIGGGPTEYAGSDGDPADEAERPLAEAGEGVSEGQEQAEADLRDNAVLRDAGLSGAEAQIEEAIDRQGDPLHSEIAEPLVSNDPPADAEERA